MQYWTEQKFILMLVEKCALDIDNSALMNHKLLRALWCTLLRALWRALWRALLRALLRAILRALLRALRRDAVEMRSIRVYTTLWRLKIYVPLVLVCTV